MSTRQVAALLLIAGSIIFLVGAAIGVPRVFTEQDPAVRLQLLLNHLTAWRAAQPLYAAGPLIAAAGVGCLVPTSGSPTSRGLYVAACATLALGALPWAWATHQRGRLVHEFAYRQLPGWPFAAYVLLTIGGLALLGMGLLTATGPAWLGWLIIGADVAILIAYLSFKDIPPFVFYLLLTFIGTVLATRGAQR